MNENSDILLARGEQDISPQTREAITPYPKNFASHPHREAVHKLIQQSLSAQPAPGVTASIGVSKADAKAKMDAGVTPDLLAQLVGDNLKHLFSERCIAGERATGTIGETVIDGEEVAVSTLSAVVFTDEQFGEFLVAIECAFLAYLDVQTQLSDL